jgi:coproporphyrinogen III oxidase-like Fe-S oxidoreductase
VNDDSNARKFQDGLRHELRRRMARPQRHRLLQGYPMAPLMREAYPNYSPFPPELDSSRPLIIGVLPHTFCNPKVQGCGFCTFPHEAFAHEPMKHVVEQVAKEIEHTLRRQPSLRERTIEAVYFGGGTANLTPPEGMKRLVESLASAFDMRGAELTLEGVPKYFLLHKEALLDILADAPVRHRRISMGIQTFDGGWLRRMGRDAFGGMEDIRRVIDSAHRRGFTVSADLLFNLPRTATEHALADVRTAIGLGLDQICVYNLVLTENLPTAWAREDLLVRAMPRGARALETWLAVRELLLQQGYLQTTLTNFERADIAQSPRRFIYELASFDPATRDGLGFGPGALSTFTGRDRQHVHKWSNLSKSGDFASSMIGGQSATATLFEYGPQDLRLLHLTRNLARLQIDGEAYERFFGTELLKDFPAYFELFEETRLMRFEGRVAHLTPEGMFYADSIAGLLAHQRMTELRQEAQLQEEEDRDSERARMG